MLAWDPETPVREILIEYARFFFAPEVAESAADGILALEKNWIGSLRDNGGVEATLALWEGLERRAPRLEGNWRWQMCLVRAVYDAYTRHRLIDEIRPGGGGERRGWPRPRPGAPRRRWTPRSAVLNRAETDRVRPDLRKPDRRAVRGAVPLDRPPDQHAPAQGERGGARLHPRLRRSPAQQPMVAGGRVRRRSASSPRSRRGWPAWSSSRTWEHPGPGSFYDDVGDPAKSPHVLVGDLTTLGLSTAADADPGGPLVGEGPEPEAARLDGRDELAARPCDTPASTPTPTT